MAVERPTFHESWYRVADLRPRLRSAVQTYRQHYRGRTWHVVQDPSNNQHFRLDEAAYHFVALLDGKRKVSEVWQLCNEQLGDRAPTQGEVINLLGQLYTSNLLHSDLPADAAGMFEIHRKRVRRQVGGFFMNLLFMRIPLFDPDHILDRWARVFGPAFTWFGFACWVMLLAVAGYQLVGRGGELLSGVSGILAPENLFLLYVCFAGIKALHEFGHGFASKQFGKVTGSGGEVHTMGIMLLVFTPVPYVDASSSWAFRSKWHRAIVGAAGMYVELAVASVAAIVWANTSPGLVSAIAYNIIFIASVSTLLFNGNPLLRFDGYYILSDLLEIPNLSKRSRDYLYYLVKRYVYGVKRATSVIRSSGERWWLPVYGVASTVYRIIIFTGIILFVADKFFFVGALFAIAAVVSWVFIPAGKFARYLLSNNELQRVRPRAVTISAIFFAAVFVTIGAVRFPDRARAQGVVEPRDVVIVYVESDGFVDEVLPTGRHVTPDGVPLLTASNLELETERAQLLADRRLTLIQRNQADVDEVAVAQSLTERLQALDEQIDRIDQRLEALRLHAPIAGTWNAPDIDRVEGAYVRRGDPVGMVADLDHLLVRAIADQRLGPRIEPEIGTGGQVEIRVKGRPDLQFNGIIEDVLPAGFERLPSAALGYLAGGSTQVAMDDESGTSTIEPFFEVHIAPDSTLAQAQLWSGERVEIRFSLRSRPLMAQWWRALRQLVQRRFQI
ncbi:MAG: efflux RND transporter periplasmic adaptor subunit [Planctomycetota bacterium]|jgi:putative peptide zinc metalloprotease protein